MAINLYRGRQSSDKQERSEWKEFKRQNIWHADVLMALLNARSYHAGGTRAQHAYDAMILQLFSVHVSDAARERYKQGFTEEQIDAGYAGNDMATACVVSSEADMLKALEEISPWNGGDLDRMLSDYFYSLYRRWQRVKTEGLAAVEARSGNGANLLLGAEESLNFRGSGDWDFIPLPEQVNGDNVARDN